MAEDPLTAFRDSGWLRTPSGNAEKEIVALFRVTPDGRSLAVTALLVDARGSEAVELVQIANRLNLGA